MELADLGLSSKTESILRRYGGIENLHQLREKMSIDPVYVEDLPYIGSKRMEEINKFLDNFDGVSPAGNMPPENDQVGECVEVTGYCAECHSKLKVVPWNTQGNILICDNQQSCSRYRQPQGWVTDRKLFMENINKQY